jgi:glycosyltransferase involved in cell wall biosynthesis
VRILLVTDWARFEGGVERYVEILRRELTAAGDDVRLLVSSAGHAAGGSADYVAFGTESRALQAGLQIVNPAAAACVRAAVRRFRPDVAHVSMFEIHLSPAALLALEGVPTVLDVAYYKPVCPTAHKLLPDGSICRERAGLVCWRSGCVGGLRWLRDRPFYALVGAAVARARLVLACSEWVRAELARNGIDSVCVGRPAELPRDGFARAPAELPTFAYVGRLSREKGVALLLESFARVRKRVPAALRIAGDGPERPGLERRAAELGLGRDVTFEGALDRGGVDGVLAGAWALVAPSLWAEPLGIVALEAIVRGVPVIASSTGGFAETVEPGVSGTLFANGDGDALARCLEAVARRSAFPGLSVPPEAVGRLRVRSSVPRHVARVRALLAESTGRA